jgi:hypothetical protein
MNREIKFRAWDDGRMVYMTGALASISRFFRVIRKDSILLQFTGLKDKNGKEIYEGDMVVADHNGAPYHQVVFLDYGFFAECKGGLYALNSVRGIMTVVGNIYETPHLLNSDKKVKECDATKDDSSNAA